MSLLVDIFRNDMRILEGFLCTNPQVKASNMTYKKPFQKCKQEIKKKASFLMALIANLLEKAL